jgi:hypothetical protein
MQSGGRAAGGKIVGRWATVRAPSEERAHFGERHRRWIGERGRVHAVVGDRRGGEPLIKLRFADDSIVFYRLSDLDIDESEAPEIVRHRKGLDEPAPLSSTTGRQNSS